MAVYQAPLFSINVFVSAPAHFIQKSKQVQVEKGDQAHLQCTAQGDNPLDIVWKMGGQRLSEDLDARFVYGFNGFYFVWNQFLFQICWF